MSERASEQVGEQDSEQVGEQVGEQGEHSGAWDDAPVGLLVLSIDGTVLAANATLLAWVGRPRSEVVGAALSRLFSVGGRIYWETHLSPLLHMQGGVDEVAVELRGADELGGRLPVLLTARRRSDDGVLDVALSRASERSRYERELLAARSAADRSARDVLALQRVTAALSTASGVDAVAQALLSAAVAHRHAAGAARWLTGPDGPVLHGAVGATVPPSQELTGGAAVVPLRGRAHLHGSLVLIPHTGPAADPLEPEMLTAAAHVAGLAMDQAVLFDQSRTVAHALQHALLVTNVPADDRFSVSTEYHPGVQALEIGGDWYDVFAVDEDVLAVSVGDVVGRGLPAATAMGQLRSAVRAIAGPGIGPAALLTRLDRFVQQTGVGTSTTVAYAELDLRTGALRYASAGHLPPLLVRAAGATFLWGGRSTPLGVPDPTGVRSEATEQLTDADTLVLYTDGLVERRDRSLDVGLGGLRLLASGTVDGGTLVGRIVADAVRSDGHDRDDVCVLGVTWTP